MTDPTLLLDAADVAIAVFGSIKTLKHACITLFWAGLITLAVIIWTKALTGPAPKTPARKAAVRSLAARGTGRRRKPRWARTKPLNETSEAPEFEEAA